MIFIISYSNPGGHGWHNIHYCDNREEAELYILDCVERRKTNLEPKEEVYIRRQGDVASVYSNRRSFMFLPSLQEVVSYRIEELKKDNKEEEDFVFGEETGVELIKKSGGDFS